MKDQEDTAPPPANNREALRRVVRACNKAALATSMGGERLPYVSLVTVGFDHDLSPILLLSGLAEHTRHVMGDGRVALLLDGTEGLDNPQTGPRVTLIGRAERCPLPRCRERFLARHPGAALYADFADFGFWRVSLQRAQFVGGFGRAVWFDTPFGLSPEVLARLEAVESGFLAEKIKINDWQVVGLDADGVDVMRDGHFRRLPFPVQVTDAETLRQALAALQA